ncbi:MAG: phosphoglucosamine mutase [Paludibacteraceae bacterium]|jgi:phosphomannomutase|nr:phosphoglucosamine mutase [Paludibacteraceae bacterium]
MALVKSISGIRGTIGGRVAEGLSPVDVVRFVAAYATQRKAMLPDNKTIVVGRDARLSGEMVDQLVCGTLVGMGYDVINIGLATTPTTELAVTGLNAAGGIILTASHNPKQWNALKLLNEKGEFLNDVEGKEVLAIAEAEDFNFAEVDDLGKITRRDYLEDHVRDVMALELVDKAAIEAKNYTVAIDCVNSVGGLAIPAILKALGVKNIIELNCEPTGHFAHNPEPLPQNLTEISDLMREGKADVGFVVDPDVDRLAIICENGDMFGEEYTLVSVADYVLSKTPGNTVSNMSSTRALSDVTVKHGGSYSASAVGEVNVTTEMKRTNAVIGGEGNGGVIYPASHYGRDALVGIALFLSSLAQKGCKVSELRATFPEYCISKNRIDLTPEINVDKVLEAVKEKYAGERINDKDGVKIDFADGWVHLRKSNTEPIIRVYSEAATMEEADALAKKVIDVVWEVVG